MSWASPADRPDLCRRHAVDVEHRPSSAADIDLWPCGGRPPPSALDSQRARRVSAWPGGIQTVPVSVRRSATRTDVRIPRAPDPAGSPSPTDSTPSGADGRNRSHAFFRHECVEPCGSSGRDLLGHVGQRLERSPWKDPLMLGTTNFVQPGEVLVVMQHDQVRVPRRSRDHKVRNRYPMLTADRERMLQGDCGLHHLRSDWRRIKTTAAYAHPLVVGQASRAVEHFQIDHCTRRDIAFLQERKDTFGNLGHGKARQHALVCQECSLQRQAPAITFGSFKSRPSMDASWAA